jgi:5-methylthioadenosine/S-adenosylhomocysteine deaminase
MSTPAQKVTLLITNATIVTVNHADQVIANGAIAVSRDTIVDIGSTADVVGRIGALEPATVRIDAKGAIVLPGFINLHAHLAMTLFRGWADNLDLQGFLDRLFPAEAAVVSPDAIRVGSDLAFAESLRAGITTSLDMYFYPEVTAQSAHRFGARVANGPVIFDFPGPENLPYPQRIEDARAQLEAGRNNLCAGRFVSAHSTYTVSIDHLVEVHEMAKEFGARFNIHAAENASEVATVVANTGRRPVALLDEIGLLDEQTVLAHCVELTSAEIDTIAATGAHVAHNPLSNMKLASGFAPVPQLLHAGANVGLGTDGPASSNDLDLYTAMRFAATMHKGHTLDALLMTANQVLRMATIDGAKALGLDTKIGSIEIGKYADLQVLAIDSPSLTPLYDPVSALVFAASRADVCTVIVNGEIVVSDRTLTNVDIHEVIREATATAEKVRTTG